MGASEIILVFVVYLLFFGSKGIPSLARNMGRAVRQFRDATNDIQREIMDGAKDIKREVEREAPRNKPTENSNNEES